jgi:hypothetical protein
MKQSQGVNQSETRVPLRIAAAQLTMSPFGLQKILARTGKLIRDDGHWFVNDSVISEIKQARSILGLKSRIPIGDAARAA